MHQQLLGQAEKPASKLIADKFETLYNGGQYDSIFDMFSTSMKTAVPSDKTTEFLSGLKSLTGNITKIQFIKYQSGSALTKPILKAESEP